MYPLKTACHLRHCAPQEKRHGKIGTEGETAVHLLSLAVYQAENSTSTFNTNNQSKETIKQVRNFETKRSLVRRTIDKKNMQTVIK